MKPIFVVLLILASGAASAECERTQIPPEARPGLDGPGSFGELDGTVTLECLTYIDYEEENSKPVAILEDETGVKHRVNVGDRVGENFGVVKEISPASVTIRQIVKDQHGEWVKAQSPVFIRRAASK